MAGISRSDADSVMREIAFGVIEEERGERVHITNYISGHAESRYDKCILMLLDRRSNANPKCRGVNLPTRICKISLQRSRKMFNYRLRH